MYNNTKYNVKISINLENGIYVFDNESATGKTRLYKELKEHTKLGESVFAYSYNDDKLGIDLDKILKSKDFKVILLDRYDMYNGSFSDILIDKSKSSIILIDCKNILNINYDADWCYIEMSSGKIEVLQ